MKDASELIHRIPYAAIAGFCAFAGSLFGKFAGSSEHVNYVCGVIHLLENNIYQHPEVAADTCEGKYEHLLVRGLFLVCMVVSNAAVWTFYVKALQAYNSSLPATLISSSTNFILSAVFGAVVFGEATSLLWWSGTFLVLVGLLLVSGKTDTDTSKKES